LFDSRAYEAIFEASGGIPRRINSLCDRLLLSGFLAGKTEKTEFTVSDVQEVAKEISEEIRTSFSNDSAGVTSIENAEGGLADSRILDISLARLELDSNNAEEAIRVITDLKSGLNDQRIARLERSMTRIERTSAATLTLLQQFVKAIRIRQEKESQS
jgi:hypothetical protein